MRNVVKARHAAHFDPDVQEGHYRGDHCAADALEIVGITAMILRISTTKLILPPGPWRWRAPGALPLMREENEFSIFGMQR
jgi:hypothetical protein